MRVQISIQLAMFLFASAILSGCNRTEEDTSAVSDNSNPVVQNDSDSPPPVPENSALAPSGPVTQAETFVVESVPVLPGSKVDVISVGPPRKLLVSNATVSNVRWKVPGPFQSPKYPASGFVTLNLAENQWEAIGEVGDIAVQTSE